MGIRQLNTSEYEMRLRLTLTLLTVGMLSGGTDAAAPYGRAVAPSGASPVPVVVLLRHSAWYNAVSMPLLIAYEDGTVLFPDSLVQDVPVSHASAKLPVGGAETVQLALGVDTGIFALPRRYDLRPNWTDQESILLFVRHGDSLIQFVMRAAQISSDSLADSIPESLRSTFTSLRHFRAPAVSSWTPDSLYVFAWPYEYAPDDPPLKWPEGWPNLESAGTEILPDEFVDTIVKIPMSYGKRLTLDSLLSLRRLKQAICISGHKWAVGYRIPFPAEGEWRQLFELDH